MVARLEARLARALDQHVEPGDPLHAWSAVRPAWSPVTVCVLGPDSHCPLIAPTGTLLQFSDARHRVYMSATLGQSGELERNFGIDKIDRIPLPRGWERQGSGRRLVLFPSIAGEPDFSASIEEAMKVSGHALAIAPSDRQAQVVIDDFVPCGVPVLSKDDVREDFDGFTDQEQAVLVLANRYDGMDLPDEACRLVLLYGLPSGSHLQERFLFDTLGALEALEERIRTRVTQGMAGRPATAKTLPCLIVWRDLTSFMSREDVRASMRPELQAEVSLGLNYADEEVATLDAVRAFLAQGEAWGNVEAHLRELADENRGRS